MVKNGNDVFGGLENLPSLEGGRNKFFSMISIRFFYRHIDWCFCCPCRAVRL